MSSLIGRPGIDRSEIEPILMLLDNSPDIYSRFDRQFRYLYINKAAERAAGIPREAYLGRTFRELGFPEETCALWEEGLRQSFATGEPALIEFSVPLPGGIRHFEGASIAERDENGEVISVLTVTRDITDRLEAGLALRESDERLRLAVEAAEIGTWDYYPLTGELRWNDRCRELFGLPPNAPVDYPIFLSGVHADDRDRVVAAVASALDPAGEGGYDIEYRTVGIVDGMERWVVARGRGYFDDSHIRATRFIGTAIDITARMRAEEALRKSDTHLRRAADIFRFTAKPVVVGAESARVIEVCNPAFAALYGYTPEEMAGMPILDVYAPVDRPLLAERIRHAHETGRAIFTAEHVRRDGSLFPVEVDITAVKDDGGQVLYRIVNVTDITERKRIETEQSRAIDALARSEERLRLALDAAHMGTWDWEVATGKLNWAGHLEEIHGMAPGSFDGRYETFLERIHPDDREWVVAQISKALETGEGYAVEFRVVYPNGEVHWVAGNGRAERDPDGRPVRMIGMGWDITALKRAEESARARAERETLLNRIGELLRSTTDDTEIASAALQALGEALGADRAYISTFDMSNDIAEIARDWRRLPSDDAEAPLSMVGEYRPAAHGARMMDLYHPNKPLIVPDILADPRYPPEAASWLAGMGLRSLLGVGLFERGLLTASLTVAMADAPRSWTTDEASLVQAFATQLRAAMEAARVRKRERNIADRLQQALRPSVPTALPGLKPHAYYRAALDEAEIGGDFYDVYPLEKGCYALVVADVSGKGLQAATQIATVRHMLRALLYQRRTTVSESITELNEMLAEHDLLTGFVTIFVGVYDVNARSIAYVSCGQEPGLLRRADTGLVEELGPTGPVLGGFIGVTYREVQISLRPGDVLALFTDGITEAGPSRREMLGLEGITALLRELAQDPTATPEEIAVGLIAGVEKQATLAGIRDDVCLLVARVE